MGGGASRAEHYELIVAKNAEAFSRQTKLSNAAPVLGSKAASIAALQKQKSSRKSFTNLNSAQVAATNDSSTSDTAKTPQKFARAKTMISLSGAGASSPSSATIRVSCKIPWILKEASIHSSSASTNLEFGKIIGEGLMGTVSVARLTTAQPPVYVAVKSISKSYIARHNDYRHVNNERELLAQMTSPFCIRLFGTYQDDIYIHLITEYVAGGELFRRLSKKSSFPPEVAKFYVCEIYAAINHVQSLGYVYRDLKPENVLLDEYGHCKLVDFGFATKPNADGQCLTNVGTPAYLSPEQLNGKFTRGYTKIVDWWSLGVLLYELLTGITPFCKNFKDSPYEIYLRVLKGKIRFPRQVKGEARDLIEKLLHADVQTRLVDPKEIKHHVYFSNVDWNAVLQKRVVPPFVPRLTPETMGDDHYFDNLGTLPQKVEKLSKQKSVQNVARMYSAELEGF